MGSVIFSMVTYNNAGKVYGESENLDVAEWNLSEATEIAAEAHIEASTSADEWISDSEESSFEYPINSDSSEWAQYETHDEMLAACTVPDEMLVEMSTEDLINIVLKYPLLCDIFAYDSYKEGLFELAVNFNGLRELLNRENGAELLLERYANYEISTQESISQVIPDEIINEETEQVDEVLNQILEDDETVQALEEEFNEVSGVQLLEMLLTSDEILSDLDADKQEEFSEIAYEKYCEKQESDLYEGVEDTVYQIAEENENLDVLGEVTRTEEDDIASGSGTTYVKTPKGSSVQVITSSYKGATWAKNVTAQYKLKYPYASVLASADNRYNCHSYAWYSASTSNRYWMNNPSKYTSDGSYKSVGSKPTASGQKVRWVLNGGILHSGIVYSYTSSKITITSKWGQAPLMRHSATYSPYAGTRTYYKRA